MNDVCGLDGGEISWEIFQLLNLHIILTSCHYASVTISLENLAIVSKQYMSYIDHMYPHIGESCCVVAWRQADSPALSGKD
jgi:hypothetical protein